ncbi:hypothetical protein LO80_03880 [Candidatus Francisella endociliophora]|uniref:Uncharacterized protein n=1 Tax=Candidatus Francisella endociliophora TaxID=653937 RepID=A0A097ENQ7_9GAMM|nr:hypothetical protein [Francisella sp. FSC1006]AIT09194.1 hypothetical protein LO80_03880 [Francisella sp. FSC1006]
MRKFQIIIIGILFLPFLVNANNSGKRENIINFEPYDHNLVNLGIEDWSVGRTENGGVYPDFISSDDITVNYQEKPGVINIESNRNGNKIAAIVIKDWPEGGMISPQLFQYIDDIFIPQGVMDISEITNRIINFGVQFENIEFHTETKEGIDYKNYMVPALAVIQDGGTKDWYMTCTNGDLKDNFYGIKTCEYYDPTGSICLKHTCEKNNRPVYTCSMNEDEEIYFTPKNGNSFYYTDILSDLVPKSECDNF